MAFSELFGCALLFLSGDGGHHEAALAMALRMDISTVALVVERKRGMAHTATPTTRQRQARRTIASHPAEAEVGAAGNHSAES